MGGAFLGAGVAKATRDHCASPRTSLGKTSSNVKRQQTHPCALFQPFQLEISNWGTQTGELRLLRGGRSVLEPYHCAPGPAGGSGVSLSMCLDQAAALSKGPRLRGDAGRELRSRHLPRFPLTRLHHPRRRVNSFAATTCSHPLCFPRRPSELCSPRRWPLPRGQPRGSARRPHRSRAGNGPLGGSCGLEATPAPSPPASRSCPSGQSEGPSLTSQFGIFRSQVAGKA